MFSWDKWAGAEKFPTEFSQGIWNLRGQSWLWKEKSMTCDNGRLPFSTHGPGTLNMKKGAENNAKWGTKEQGTWKESFTPRTRFSKNRPPTLEKRKVRELPQARGGARVSAHTLSLGKTHDHGTMRHALPLLSSLLSITWTRANGLPLPLKHVRSFIKVQMKKFPFIKIHVLNLHWIWETTNYFSYWTLWAWKWHIFLTARMKKGLEDSIRKR